jgi:hypothetical protein
MSAMIEPVTTAAESGDPASAAESGDMASAAGSGNMAPAAGTGDMKRVEEFKAEIAEMRLRDPATGRDRQLLRLGVVLLVLGVVLTVAAYFMSHGTTNPLSQRDAIILALAGVAVSVAGGALFLRYSLATFLRFWLARLIYEQQTQTDRIVRQTDAAPR